MSMELVTGRTFFSRQRDRHGRVTQHVIITACTWRSLMFWARRRAAAGPAYKYPSIHAMSVTASVKWVSINICAG
jgi:hypothetical protein